MEQESSEFEPQMNGSGSIHNTFRGLISPGGRTSQFEDSDSVCESVDSDSHSTVIYVKRNPQYHPSRFNLIDPSQDSWLSEAEHGGLEQDEYLYSRIRKSKTPSIVFPPPKQGRICVLKESLVNNPVAVYEHEARIMDKNIQWYDLTYWIAVVRHYISSVCFALIQHPAFDFFILCLIIANCVIIAIEDPTSDQTSDWQTETEILFQVVFTIEVIIKVCGMGFMFSEAAYLRDPWNVLDFVIVFFGLVGLFSGLNLGGDVDLKTLRTFRILRPLRTITSLEGLKLLMIALFTSIPLLLDIIIILLFFFVLFAVAGVQLWHGLLYYRCMDLESGDVMLDVYCGDASCKAGQVCVRYITNPNNGATSFDDIFSGLLTIFQSVTLQGWTDNQLVIVDTSGYYPLVYFIVLTVVGGFFIINFSLAVITSRVTQLLKDMRKTVAEKKEQDLLQRAATIVDKQKNKVRNLLGVGALSILSQSLQFSSLLAKSESARQVPTTRKDSQSNLLFVRNSHQIEEIKEDLLEEETSPQLMEECRDEIGDFDYLQFESEIRRASRDDSTKSELEAQARKQKNFLKGFTAALLSGQERDDGFEEKTNEALRDMENQKVLNSQLRLMIPKIDYSSITLHNLSKSRATTDKGSANVTFQEEEEPETTGSLQFFILKDNPISVQSAEDVLPKHFKVDFRLSTGNKAVLPPYKMKIDYLPVNAPKEETQADTAPELEEPKTVEKAESTKHLGGIANKSAIDRSAMDRSAIDPSVIEEKRSDSSMTMGKPPVPRQLTKQESKRAQRVHEAKTSVHRRRREATEIRARQLGLLNSTLSEATPDNTPSHSISPTPVNKILKKYKIVELPEEGGEGSSMKPVSACLEDIKFEDRISSKPIVKWCGEDVVPSTDPTKAEWVTNYINEIRVWKQGWHGVWLWIRHSTKQFVREPLFDNIILLLVLINSILLGMQRYGQSEDEEQILQIFNLVFTSIYCSEMALKLFGLGVVKYFMDAFNYLDCFIVLFSLAEIIFLDGQGSLSAFLALRVFKVVRMFRYLRVIRVARLLKSFRAMHLIIEVIGKTIAPFAYISILLGVFIFIYALLGMQLFGGKFDFKEGKPRQNFDSFHHAFLCVYQTLTLEDWHKLLYNGMRVQHPVVAVMYFASWIFLGNYVLLNLFLAIMFDAFSHIDQEITEEDYQFRRSLKQDPSERTPPNKPLPWVGEKNSNRTQERGRQEDAVKSQKPARQKTKVNQVKDLKQRILPKMVERKKLLDEDLSEKVKRPKQPLHDAKSQYSLYLLSKENPVRIACWNLVTSTAFEGVVLGIIILSSLMLAVDTYFFNASNETEDTVSYSLNIFFNVAFALEALLKAAAYGFVFEDCSYLRDFWNQLDFVIIVASIADLMFPQLELQIVRIFRLFRTLRPLRFVTHNINLRILVQALFKSLNHIINIIIVVFVIFVMFSTVGVNFFAGKFQYCSISKYENHNREECARDGGRWLTYDLNFDNVLNGLVSLFVVTTLENWPNTVLQASDVTDVEQGPSVDQSWYYSYFFVIFISISSMFLMNLFVGTLFLRFSKERDYQDGIKSSAILLAEDQVNWIEVQRMIMRAKPNYEARTIPTSSTWRRYVHVFVTSLPFDIIMTIVISLNMVHMGLLYEGASEDYIYALNLLNYVFGGIFTWEIVLKMIAFGIDFWYDTWNILGLLIVLSVYVDIIFTQIYTINFVLIRIVPPLVRVLRVLRVSRLLRLMRKYKRMQELMEIIALCLPAMMNVFALLMLIIFIYAVLGCYLFYDNVGGTSINSFYNFSNFGYAVLLCLKIATGEDWDKFMFDAARVDDTQAMGPTNGKLVAFFYFISFKLIVTYVMLNFFIVAVLGLFDMYFVEQNSLVFKYKEDHEIFQEVWHKVGPSHRGFMIQNVKLIKFFQQLPEPLGMADFDQNEVSKNVLDMRIQSDKNGNVFYNELLFCVVKRARASDLKLNKILVKQEKRTRRRIQQQAESLSLGVKYQTGRKEFVMGRANPFVALMIMRLTLKLWRRFKNEHLVKVDARMRRRSTRNFRSKNAVASPSVISRTKTLVKPFKLSQVVPVDKSS